MILAVIYYPNISNIFNSIMDNNYLSSTLSKTFTKVNILLLVYILLLI